MLSMKGTAVLTTDSPHIKRGARFEFNDWHSHIVGTVTRRLRLRDGSVKVWIESDDTDDTD